jgi:hypothetical protein
MDCIDTFKKNQKITKTHEKWVSLHPLSYHHFFLYGISTGASDVKNGWVDTVSLC